MDLTTHWAGLLAIAIFIGAYVLVILEENIHLRKSKPVIVAAGFIWILVAFAYASMGDTHTAEELVRHNLLEFAELFRFDAYQMMDAVFSCCAVNRLKHLHPIVQ